MRVFPPPSLFDCQYLRQISQARSMREDISLFLFYIDSPIKFLLSVNNQGLEEFILLIEACRLVYHHQFISASTWPLEHHKMIGGYLQNPNIFARMSQNAALRHSLLPRRAKFLSKRKSRYKGVEFRNT